MQESFGRLVEALFEQFVEHPTATNYRAVRGELMGCGPFDVPADDHLHDQRDGNSHVRDQIARVVYWENSLAALRRVVELIAAGESTRAHEQLDGMLPAWALSPRLHYLAAEVAAALDDCEESELERFLFQTCLEGILDTGEGTPGNPYLITYLTDEYDVAWALGLEPQGHRLHDSSRGRSAPIDGLDCGSAGVLWFDATHLVEGFSCDQRGRLHGDVRQLPPLKRSLASPGPAWN